MKTVNPTKFSDKRAVVLFWQQKIDETLGENPELAGEEPSANDLYSTLFPKAKKSTRYGLGMVVGGKGSEQLSDALAALEVTRKENINLLIKMENMEQKTNKMEGQLNQLMVTFQASQNVQSTHQTNPIQQVDDVSTSQVQYFLLFHEY